MKEVSGNKKFVLTIASLCIAFLAICGTIIGVWAATSQSIKSSFNVQYDVGENVAAKIRTEFTDKGVTEIAHNDDKGNKVTDENGFVVINAPDENGKSVEIGDFSLTPANQEVVFYFTIENILGEGFLNISVIVTLETQNNVDYEIYYSNEEVVASESATAVESWSETVWPDNLASGQTRVIKVVIGVVNENTAASCAGSVDLELNYSAT
ncbi:MAG: hypothetical protein E7379_00240 [Clostridiales bacterium]|nr:hypothetical protein [Clostridiales bacterium]